MAFQIGQIVQHQQFGKGVITGLVDASHLKAKFEEEEFEKIISPKFLVGYSSIGDSILAIRSENLSSAFLEYLVDVKDQVDIRIHYPVHVESFVFDLFSREGLALPDDIRPLDSGARGGTTTQRTLAGEMWFPTPTNKAILPQPHKIVGSITKVSQLAVILSVLKSGFSITKYTKIAGEDY